MSGRACPLLKTREAEKEIEFLPGAKRPSVGLRLPPGITPDSPTLYFTNVEILYIWQSINIYHKKGALGRRSMNSPLLYTFSSAALPYSPR
jgi:hypothetical protein